MLVILLLCQIRAGADISFVDQKLAVSVKFCGLLLQIYPRKAPRTPKPEKQEEKPKPAEKPEKEKKPKKTKPKKEKTGPGFMISNDEVIDLLKKVLKGLGRFYNGFHVDRFLLHWLAAGKDPYDTARLFAAVNGILSALAPYCAERFHCRNTDVRTAVDFTVSEMKLDFGIAVVLRLGAVFDMLFTILFGVIGILIRNKLYWVRLKRSDPEEYAFQVENPSLATKLIRSVLEKKNSPEKENPEQSKAEEAISGQNPEAGEATSEQNPETEKADSGQTPEEPPPQPLLEENLQKEQERKPTNGE